MKNNTDPSVNDILQHMNLRLSRDIPDSVFDPSDFPENGDHKLNKDLLDENDLPKSVRPAAVLVPLIRYEGTLNVLLTQRSANLSNHAGQIAFPGGKVDAADTTPVDTALRETEEEVGVNRNTVEVLGYLDNYQTASGFRILPIVGVLNAGYSYTLQTEEVTEIFEVPLSFLMSPQNHKKEMARWQNKDRYYYAMPYEGKYIWGATAGIIRNLYERLYD